MARSIDPVPFVPLFFFFFQASHFILPLPSLFRASPPLSPVAVRSSLVIFNYRIFNRELLRLSRHGCLLFRESFALDRRVVSRDGNLFILIRSNLIHGG